MANVAQLAPSQPRERTLNERLNDACATLHFQCERIEGTLARINGTPIAGQQDGTAVKPAITPMQQAMQELEASVERMSNLATNLERVA